MCLHLCNFLTRLSEVTAAFFRDMVALQANWLSKHTEEV